MQFKFGVMQNALRCGETELIQKASECGFEAVQLWIHDADPRHSYFSPDGLGSVVSFAEKKGVEIASIGCGHLLWGFTTSADDFRRTVKSLEAVLENAARFDIPLIMEPFFMQTELKSPQNVLDTIAGFKEICPLAEKLGVSLGMENSLSWESNRRILDEVGSSALKIYYDTANAVWFGHDPAREIRAMGKEVLAEIHLKDNGTEMGVANLGEGNVPWGDCVAAIRESGFEGYLILETPSGTEPEDNARKNLQRAQELFG